jgi:negative regulator of flagellin synthesis FlgM
MTHANGIGASQEATSSITPAAAKPAVQATAPVDTTSGGLASDSNTGPVDQANLSSAGGLVAQALTGSDTRSEKVASLQQAIATGSYNVSSSDVADKIIQSLLE